MWKLEVRDEATDRTWRVNQWDRIKWSREINKPATLDVTIGGGTPIDEVLVARRSDLILSYESTGKYRGRLMDAPDSFDENGRHVVDCDTIDYAGILEHRFLQPQDRTTKVILPNPDRTDRWSPIVQYRAEQIVADTSQAWPNQLYEARRDTPVDRASEWSQTASYHRGDAAQRASVVYFRNRVYRARQDIEGIREWRRPTGTMAYDPGDLVFFRGAIYRARGATRTDPRNRSRWSRAGTRWYAPPNTTLWTHITPARPSADPANWTPVSNDSYWARVYDDTPQEDIAWDLIAMTQAKLGGDLGITRDPAHLPGPEQTLGRERDRTFQHLSQTIFDLINDTGRATDGFEWWIDADRVWRTEIPHRWNDRDDVVLQWGTTVANIRRDDGEPYVSSATFEGNDDETSPRHREVTPDERGRWEAFERDRDITRTATLVERADEAIVSAGLSLDYYKVTLAAGVITTANFELGDVVALNVPKTGRLNISAPVRIVDIDITIDGDGSEKCTIGCQEVGPDDVDQNYRVPRRPRSHSGGFDLIGDILGDLYRKAQ